MVLVYCYSEGKHFNTPDPNGVSSSGSVVLTSSSLFCFPPVITFGIFDKAKYDLHIGCCHHTKLLTHMLFCMFDHLLQSIHVIVLEAHFKFLNYCIQAFLIIFSLFCVDWAWAYLNVFLLPRNIVRVFLSPRNIVQFCIGLFCCHCCIAVQILALDRRSQVMCTQKLSSE